jgi:hypothetical protein
MLMPKLQKKVATLVPSLLALWMAAPAWAHHSFAMFDEKTSLVLKGTVTEFQWTNPHSWLQVKVPNEHGETEEWSIELGSISGLHQAGWKPKTLQPGDKVSVTVHPLRDGKKGASLVSIVIPSGQVLTNVGQGPAKSEGQ